MSELISGQTIDTPECDKVFAARDKLALLGEFYDWLASEGIRLARHVEWEDAPPGLAEISDTPERLFAGFLGIDLRKRDQEQRALLRALRSESA